ncbi:PKHD-type hydroxylase ofd1 OS=Schizosaccharomyces pombe (strain 972 / ATCC 24843) GN=ofd1 PE=1 SV=1 [Rhizoctonia solani AG-1 IB]|uniref:uS12 prolyl 3,4-dihydroxylase n=1 Tax=Thanatephorus cucumeris (strain AG1-IB / isolate 7/3/14) TaxID=1108050 RepID=A0A0B7FND6_THACB|nr:PKHD-type hydroxylase ofd1 OS=Schizosaccharomyces pombe (strain 972 / ATCC 24843) GN=ofd1 PE=1 SV=1 [Rhizoctonia solani AG-1 IB]
MVTRPFSPSTQVDTPDVKRRKINDAEYDFYPGLLDEANVTGLNAQYAESGPYKHAVVPSLFSDDLLKAVKNEILENVRFTEKETDIYKVHQTGDLASLSYLTPEQQALFPSLLKLREALYSPEFRQFVRGVTGCGPLSGKKQDMSVNSYRKGCHLLNHDDVIGTRRVSYILYMPLPLGEPWRPEWGGALELYPVKELPDGSLEPECKPTKVIPPSWNQFIFFEIQPGRSFHSVEEVVVDEGGNQRQRLSISGWFHRPQEGEDDYDPEDIPKEKSSLQQLSASSKEQLQYDLGVPSSIEELLLSQNDKEYLSQFLNPIYLESRAIAALNTSFAEKSHLDLHLFLNKDIAAELESGLKELDIKSNITYRSDAQIPSHDYGGDQSGWELAGPPHRLRYCRGTDELAGQPGVGGIIHRLRTELFSSAAFRSWLAIVAQVIPIGYAVTARRFRPGLDYTLASAIDDENRLDVCLGLTPGAGNEGGWDNENWGGWECYMAPHEGEDDPEVYKAADAKPKSSKAAKEESTKAVDPKGKGKAKAQPESDDEEEEEEGDGTLLTVYPNFNHLVIALRDAGVLKFVKYVSASAPVSRWDISSEWEIAMLGDDGEGESDDD